MLLSFSLLFAGLFNLANSETLTQVCTGSTLSCGGQTTMTARGFQWVLPYDHQSGCIVYWAGGSPDQVTIYSEALWCYKSGLRTVSLLHSDTSSANCPQFGAPGNAREPLAGHPNGYTWAHGNNIYFTLALCQNELTGYTNVWSMASQAMTTKLTVAPGCSGDISCTLGNSLWGSIRYVSGAGKSYYCCGTGNNDTPRIFEFNGSAYTDISSSVVGQDDVVCPTSTHCPGLLSGNWLGSDGTYLYAYGGCIGTAPGNVGDDNANCGASGTKTNELYRLNVSTLKWTKLAPVGGVKPPKANSSFPAMAYDSTRSKLILYADTDAWWQYDIDSNTWSTMTVVGSGPEFTSSVKLNSQGIVAAYDPATDIFVLLISYGQTNPPGIWELAMSTSGGGSVRSGSLSFGGKVVFQ